MKDTSAVFSFVDEKRKLCRAWLAEQAKQRRNDPKMLLSDLFFLGCGFLFSRTHLFFGAYPLGIAWLCALPYGVFTSLFGAMLGAFSLGKTGVVYAMIDAIAVLLRLFLSASDVKSPGAPNERFRESAMLRSSFAVISGFIAGGYEVLLSGLTLPAVIYAAVMMISAGGVTFLFSYLFTVNFPAVFLENGMLFPLFKKSGIGFSVGFGAFVFLLSYALTPISALGISLSFIFTGFLTLYAASKFGGVPAMAIGFLSAIPGGASAAVAFALAGAVSGFLFPFGYLYALLGGGAALVLWSGYTEGVTGLLSVFPEYALAASLGFPGWRKLSGSVPKPGHSVTKTAEDMVGAMALSYRADNGDKEKKVSKAFRSIVPLLRNWQTKDDIPSEKEYESIICEVLLHTCYNCAHRDLCGTAGIRNLVRGLTAKSLRGESPGREDLSFCDLDDEEKEEILFYLSLRLSDLAARHAKDNTSPSYPELCSLFSRLLDEIGEEETRRQSLDDALSESLEAVLKENGLQDGVVRVYGDRVKTVVAATEDAGGRKITSPELLKSIENAVGGSIEMPSYYRQEDMVLLSCKTRAKYRLSACVAAKSKSEKEPSGDSFTFFEAENGKYYLVLSDGMGSGEEAGAVSRFCAGYLKEMMSAGCSEETSLFLLNHLLRGQKGECASTVDLCEIDLFTGHAAFYKSGAAPSFLKRNDKVYRVRSETVPLGILPAPDTEKIHVETRAGDLIIMFSDGISTSPEDAPWLTGFLSGTAPLSLQDYAETILSEAEKHGKKQDDVSIIVAQVNAA